MKEYTIKEIAKLLSLHIVTVRRKIYEGSLKAEIKVLPKVRGGNRRWIITQEQLNDYFKKYERENGNNCL